VAPQKFNTFVPADLFVWDKGIFFVPFPKRCVPRNYMIERRKDYDEARNTLQNLS